MFPGKIYIRKEPGFCEEHGIEHAWKHIASGGLGERYCINCGLAQREELKWISVDLDREPR